MEDEYGLFSRSRGSISRLFTRYCGLKPSPAPTKCEGFATEGGCGSWCVYEVRVSLCTVLVTG